jgi:hypothetical protein
MRETSLAMPLQLIVKFFYLGLGGGGFLHTIPTKREFTFCHLTRSRVSQNKLRLQKSINLSSKYETARVDERGFSRSAVTYFYFLSFFQSRHQASSHQK